MTDPTALPWTKKNAFRHRATHFGEPVGWLRSEIYRWLGGIGKCARSVFGVGPRGLASVAAMEPVDDEKSSRLTAELPGHANKDVVISAAHGALSISGEKKVKERKDNAIRRASSANPARSRHRSRRHQRQSKGSVLTFNLTKHGNAPARTRKIAIEKA